MIVDGKQIAQEIQAELIKKVKELKSDGTGDVALHIFVVGENPVIENFVKYKRMFADTIGVEFVEHRFESEIGEDELIKEINQTTKMFQGTPGTFGVVVQLPLPSDLDTQRVLDSVPVEYDIDGLAIGSSYLPPVAGAVKEILEHEGVEVSGKSALVVGKGRLVGEPVARLLTKLGANVTVADKGTSKRELKSLTLESDIIVSGAGVPNLITEDMVKQGSVLLDAGTSTQSGNIVGDIALGCASKASVFAKTPGGIGPMTVAVLFKNLIDGALVTK